MALGLDAYRVGVLVTRGFGFDSGPYLQPCTGKPGGFFFNHVPKVWKEHLYLYKSNLFVEEVVSGRV